jgi:hypothetical protein
VGGGGEESMKSSKRKEEEGRMMEIPAMPPRRCGCLTQDCEPATLFPPFLFCVGAPSMEGEGEGGGAVAHFMPGRGP